MGALADLLAQANQKNMLARRREPLDVPFDPMRQIPRGMTPPLKTGDVANMAIQNAPGIGDVASLIDAYKAWKSGDKTGGVLSGIAALPMVGAIKSPSKDITRFLSEEGKTIVNLTRQGIGDGPLRMATNDELISALKAVHGRNTAKGLDMDIATGAIRDEQARRNAVTMLGLPESNTAADRAGAMGYDANLYHGTSAADDFDHFNTLEAYTTPDRIQAGGWAENASLGGEGVSPRVMPLRARNLKKKSKNIDPLINKAIMEDGDLEEGLNFGIGLTMGEGKRYATFHHPDAAPGGTGEHLAVASVYPRGGDLRSRFAAFDPARRDSSNLLAQILGGVGLSHIYAAMMDRPDERK
jgi:hypothetical protein